MLAFIFIMLVKLSMGIIMLQSKCTFNFNIVLLADVVDDYPKMSVTSNYWSLCNYWSNNSRLVLMEKPEQKLIEKEKIVAETLNG